MICTANDFLFAATLFVFVLAAVHSEWHMNTLMKILKLRHSAIYNSLGRPHPFRTGESDKHSVSLLMFVMSEEHASLDDAELTREIKYLRFSYAANLITVFIIFACLLVSADARALATFGCWLS